MVEETVPAALADERVDRFVAFVTGCTRSTATALVGAGSVWRNERRVRKGSDRVQEGDVVRIDAQGVEAAPTSAADPSIEIDVVYEDDDLAVINKAPGLVVHPGAGTPEGTLVNGLLARYPEIEGVGPSERPGIVHRLDKGTSGLLIIARTEDALAALSAQLGARSVDRRYFAVVWGHLENDHGMVDAPVGRSKRRRTQMAVVADGREARTRYGVLRRADEPAEVTVVECNLETGRTHQIRVHMLAIGHPVVGDDLYGGERSALLFGRPALHAAALSFTHPTSGQRLRFEVEPPADMGALLARLR